MTLTASIFISFIIISFLWFLINLIKKDKLAIRYSISWFFLAGIVLFFTWFPNVLLTIANIFGIYSPTNMLFFLGFCLSLSIIFTLTNSISIQNHKLKHLTQEIALMKKENKDEQ